MVVKSQGNGTPAISGISLGWCKYDKNMANYTPET